jgi:type I restriction enzyme S subunit
VSNFSQSAVVPGQGYTDGGLPEGWIISELGDIAETQLGKMLNSANQTGKSLKPYLRNINLQWGRIDLSDVKQMDIFQDESKQFTLEKGDVLVCEGGEPGRSAVWNFDIEMGFQNAIHRIRPSEKLISTFTCYQIEWLVRNGFLDEKFTGVTIKHFSQQKLRKVLFIAPPVREQKRIVEILDEQLSRLDAAFASVRVAREKAKRLRRSLIHAGINCQNPITSAPFERTNLGECAELSLGIMLDKAKGSGEYLTPYMGNINVRWGEFDLADLKLMDIKPEQRERSLVMKGDVVICEGGEPGRTAVWENDEPIAIQKALHRVRPLTHMNSVFVAYCLELEFRGISEHQLFTGTTIKHLPKEKLKNLQIPIPPLDVQRKIVSDIKEQLSHVDSFLALAELIEKRTIALRRSLLHAAFTGDLTREWREGAHV